MALSLTVALTGCSSVDVSTVDTGPQPKLGPHFGGTLVELSTTNSGSADPQVNYTPAFWSLQTITYDGLTAYDKLGPNAGQHVVGDLATGVPRPTDGGTKWSFVLRDGIRFSDGSPLRPADVKASFERIFKVHGPTASTLYGSIAGADKCLDKPQNCDLSQGIAISGRTITFTLTGPDPEFAQKLALPHAAILPAGTPATDQGTDVSKLHGTGPYYWASYEPTDAVVLKRNPYFHQWSAPAQPLGYPDQIVQKYGLEPTDEVTAVVNGQGDLVVDQLPGDRLPDLGARYRSRVHLDQQGVDWYWALNTRIPPFNNVKARQAVNLAFDRNAGVIHFGGPALASPSCQILPPGIPGYQPYCPWTAHAGDGRGRWKGTDLARARRLVAESGTAGQSVGVVPANDPMQVAMAEYLQTVLTQLGYRATVKPLDAALQYPYIQNSGNRVQVGLTQWYQDYPAASNFLRVLLSCGAFTPNSDSSPNIGGFCDPRADQAMDVASRLEATDPKAADAAWAGVDRTVTDQAPWISMFAPKTLGFVSKRLGNYTYSAQFGFLASRAWVW
ncbi:ABC transporter substrate-binding protein [Fodinicola feengrottensis]|uniref:ABC transporter substrate-binding protein n=1 Tax=Fodinicola feengrottensis TaxID=435914 RepID=A0ABN2JDF8_9ACTN